MHAPNYSIPNYSIMIVAGEPSGDMHAADLVRALHAAGDHYACFGMGLEAMQQAGLRRIVDATELAVVGLFEVITHYPKLRRAYRRLVRALREERPDLLVLVDYPEFNLKLAGEAKRLGIKTLFYISPQIWAWRAGRIRTIAERVDMMAVIFPFEERIYRDAGVPVRYVGHPLVEQAPRALPPRAGGGRRLLLLPGSRRGEIERMLPVLCRAAVGIRAQLPDARCSLLLAPGIPAARVEQELRRHRLECELLHGNPYAAMAAADLALTASGTATLQLALCGTPMVIIYKVAWPTYWVLRLLVRTPYIGLVNIVAGRQVVPELIQGEANPAAIREQAVALLDAERNRAMRRDLEQVRRALGVGGASAKLAALVHELVSPRAS